MPRYARKRSKTHLYHVMLRGNNREKIFSDEADKLKIINILEDKKKDREYCLYAYCVMDNHIHLIIKEDMSPVSRIVKRIAASYSYYFNKKYTRIGHVFQERYKSENIEDERYLLSAIRYVHQNPLKAGIGTLEGYKWSSYGDYLGKGRKVADTGELLKMISDSKESALSEFIRLNQEFSEETFLDIVEDKEINESNVADYIGRYLSEKGLNQEDLKSADFKSVREELIRFLLERSNLSGRRIASSLGLNRETVRKITMSRDLSP
ncbi:transposase [Candidatus Formimonas warabiya]|uniref:Transposase IS200-like domain-containing protein n=1 Tax=Formimonas warabiya TaxID=1761012 RepID=A0A3G1KWC5_FORW1|nr:transposase [Candidatus Formimonas warabiya]ATW26843.1 hypothetical protein DCMF_20610 [Candidatus Formimonas warabiya]